MQLPEQQPGDKGLLSHLLGSWYNQVVLSDTVKRQEKIPGQQHRNGARRALRMACPEVFHVLAGNK